MNDMRKFIKLMEDPEVDDQNLDEDFFQSDFVKLQKDGFRAGWNAALSQQYDSWEDAFAKMKHQQKGSR